MPSVIIADNSNKICDFILNTPAERIPQSALDMAALLVADTLAVTAAASTFPAGKIARETALNLYGTSQHHYQVPMLYDGRRASIAGAAYAAATQTDNLDAHDGYYPTKGHIGCAVIPAAFAFAAAHDQLLGPDFLAAVVIGYEIAARAAMSLHATVSDYHTSGAWNGIGVAAVGSRLRGHNQNQLCQALGIAEFHGPRSQMMREIANPTMLHDGSGMGALTGTSAVILAEQGFTGAPAITVFNDDVSNLWEDLGQAWTIEQNYIKPYPICRWAHPAIEAIEALKKAHHLKSEDIDHILIRTFWEATQLSCAMPQTSSMAQYALGYPVALMACYGYIAPEHVRDDMLENDDIRTLLAKIEVIACTNYSDRFPAERLCDMQVRLLDGSCLQSAEMAPRGGPEAPLSRDDIREKFVSYCKTIMAGKTAQRFWTQLMTLGDEKMPLSALNQWLYPDV